MFGGYGVPAPVRAWVGVFRRGRTASGVGFGFVFFGFGGSGGSRPAL